MAWFKGTPGIYVCSCKDSQTGQIPLGQWARLGIRFGRADRCLENKHDLVSRNEVAGVVCVLFSLSCEDFVVICWIWWLNMAISRVTTRFFWYVHSGGRCSSPRAAWQNTDSKMDGDLISRTLIEANRGMPNSHLWVKTRLMLATQQQTTHILIGIPPIYGKIGNGTLKK
jgi:hypothetical protein